jgi:hypothetical protein
VSETWTPKTEQSETWTAQPGRVARLFDPYIFDRAIFDTGTTAGVWDDKSEQAEVWTPA